jgi:hypothetical protein
MPRVWRDTFDMSDWPLRLTPEEASALYEEWREMDLGRGRGAPEQSSEARPLEANP